MFKSFVLILLFYVYAAKAKAEDQCDINSSELIERNKLCIVSKPQISNPINDNQDQNDVLKLKIFSITKYKNNQTPQLLLMNENNFKITVKSKGITINYKW